MKMIGHQTITKDVCKRHQMLAHLLKEKEVILMSREYNLLVIPLIVEVVDCFSLKVHLVG
jgi:hypothetical protein